MSYWCPKPQGTNADIYSKRSTLTQIMAVKNINWETIHKRLKTHPQDAAERDKFGVTALHHAIRKQQQYCQTGNHNNIHSANANANAVPLEIFRLLIEEYPDSLDVCDSMTGCNALHVACGSHCTDEMKDIINKW